MSKVVFLEPRAANPHIFSGFGIPRLGSVLLATILRGLGHDAGVFVEDIREVDFERVLSADLAAISVLTPTAPRGYEMARQIHARGVPVIMGGPHVTFLADEALEHCDFVIRGEAERSMPAFMNAWSTGADLASVPGLSYRRGREVVHNPVDPAPVDIRANPIPDMSLVDGYDSRRGVTRWRIVPIQTSRGCPFACSFCSVTQMFGRGMRYRETSDVLDELDRCDPRRDFVFFYDDNFCVNLPRTRRILEGMIDRRPGWRWSAQVRIDVARDEEFLRLMCDSGCRHIYIGFESISDETLALMKKAQTSLQATKAIEAIHRHGIGIHGMFVFGFDTDTKKDLKRTWRYAMKQKLRTAQFMILTPMPGTDTYRVLEGENRIEVRDWSFYDGQHVVFRPKHLSPAELQWCQIRAHRCYYSWRERIKSIFRLDLYRATIQVYAKGIGQRWIRQNRYYLKAIKLARRAEQAIAGKGSHIAIRFHPLATYRDVHEQVEHAVERMRARGEKSFADSPTSI
ncbi:MAG: B12-binding domain-containing radical SAM protein [Deltaproteobacteria bacterium]|nr:B12-binding domain-containing radical SAM protein [Deltaproteobacteria bacterium]